MLARSDRPRINRREFARYAAAGLASSWLAACERYPDGALPVEPQFSQGRGGGGGGGKPGSGGSRNPLFIPETVQPSGLVLNMGPTLEDLGGGKMATALTYNGQLPGPVIEADRYDNATITMNNGLSQPSITHWHGMMVDHVNDGHPVFAVDPGGWYNYDFTIDQRAAMNWYHPHPHKLTGEQVCLGLAGPFIIRDSVERSLGLPAGPPYEVPLVIRDATLDKSGNLQYKPRSGGFVGQIPLVNGTIDPQLGVDPTVYRLRVLNGANARIFRLVLSDGSAFTLIGNDGGLLATAVSIGEIVMSPGERIDVLVDFRGFEKDRSVMLKDLDSGWDLLEFVVTSTGSFGGPIPTALSTITPLTDPGQPPREFSFDGMSRINGHVYDMFDPGPEIRLGDTEVWRFTTNGNAPHPVHVHAASFQVKSRYGGRNEVFPWEQGWKDTVLLEDGETVDVLVHFHAHKGLFLMHCHKLEHEDMGMMTNFTVT